MVSKTTWSCCWCLLLLTLLASLKFHVVGGEPALSTRHGQDRLYDWPHVSYTQCLRRCILDDNPRNSAQCQEICSKQSKTTRLSKHNRMTRGLTACDQVKKSEQPEGVIPPEDVSADFYLGNNNSDFFVNITWKPLNETKWKVSRSDGYILRYHTVVFNDFSPKPMKCVLLPKNQTSVSLHLTSQKNQPAFFFVNVSTYPAFSSNGSLLQHKLKEFRPPTPSTPPATPPPTCDQVKKSGNPEGVIPPEDVSVKFYRGENNNLFANITWKPLNETECNVSECQGYILRYAGYKQGSDPLSMRMKCIVLPKSQTYVIVGSSDGWTYPVTLQLNVSTYPIFNASMPAHKLMRVESPAITEAPITPKTTSTATLAITDGTNTTKTKSNTSGSFRETPTTPSSGMEPAYIIVAALGALIGGIFVIIGAFLWMRRRNTFRLPPQSSEFEYDAFIVYSSKDREFTEGILLSLLENDFRLKCCIHYRDFKPGAPYVDNMVQSVLKSRKIIAVMSKSFLESNFCDYELQIAMQRLLEWRDNSVLVIKVASLGQREMPVLLKKRSYIDYTKLVERTNWTSRLRAFLTRSEETTYV